MKYPQQSDIMNGDKWVLCSSSSLLQKQTADVITLCFKWHEKQRVRRSPAACSCFVVHKQVSFVLGACWVFYLLLLLGSVQMRPRWEMRRSFPGHQKRSEGCKLVWETSPYTTVSCSWYLCAASPPCRTLHRFFSALSPSHCLLLLLSVEQVLLPAATKLCMTAISTAFHYNSLHFIVLCNVCVCGDVTGSVLWLAAHQTDWGTVTPVQSTVWLAAQPTNGASGCQWQRWTRPPQLTHDERSLCDCVGMLHVRLCPRDLMLIPVTLVTLVTLLHFRGFCFREHQVFFVCFTRYFSCSCLCVSSESLQCHVQDKDYLASVHNHRPAYLTSEVQTFSLNSRSFTKICINCLLFTNLHLQTSKSMIFITNTSDCLKCRHHQMLLPALLC